MLPHSKYVHTEHHECRCAEEAEMYAVLYLLGYLPLHDKQQCNTGCLHTHHTLAYTAAGSQCCWAFTFHHLLQKVWQQGTNGPSCSIFQCLQSKIYPRVD